jgi:TetR/AcrR family transcriptional regulator, fatty acid metabolism regulator protein
VPNRVEAAERREQILAAATRVFADRGFDAARVSDIANEAGVAYGLVYHYFASKDEILRVIFRATWTQMLERIHEIEQRNVAPEEQLRMVVALVLRTWTRDPDLVRVLVREVTRGKQLEEEVEEIRLAFQALERIVTRGQEKGRFWRELDPRFASLVLYGALEEVLTSWVLGGLSDAPDDVTRAEENVVQLLSRGLVKP